MDQKPRSRANSVINQIKLWTSSNHSLQSNNNNNNNTKMNNHNSVKQFGSSVAVQKLRESKWFGLDESRIFCAVVECGFIVETREGQENDGWFGVVMCKTSKGIAMDGFFFLFFFFFQVWKKGDFGSTESDILINFIILTVRHFYCLRIRQVYDMTIDRIYRLQCFLSTQFNFNANMIAFSPKNHYATSLEHNGTSSISSK